LKNCEDISEYVLRGTGPSESDIEDGPENQITLTQKYQKLEPSASAKSAIRLHEIGPRITMQLIKIEEGFCQGIVLYHHFSKNPLFSILFFLFC
jgi:ribosome biogenesis protein SSF1/2